MKPRTAIITLLILTLILFGVVFYLVQTREQTNNQTEQNNSATQLSPAAIKQEALTQTKIEEKRRTIEQIPSTVIKQNGYTPDQADFILNPRGNIEKELGIKPATSTNRLTPQAINNILNPKR